MKRRAALGALLTASALPLAARADDQHAGPPPVEFDAYVPGAARLEGRILAPCCWNQTLDIHGSEPAMELRREIRKRLVAGETSDAIEADLVRRYGERILASPPGSPIFGVGVALTAVMAAGAFGAYRVLRSWKKPAPALPTAPAPDDAALDERLDRELEQL